MNKSRTPVKTKMEKILEVKTVEEVVFALRNAAAHVRYHPDVFEDLSEDFYLGASLNIGTSLNTVTTINQAASPAIEFPLEWRQLVSGDYDEIDVDLPRLRLNVARMIEEAIDFISIAEDLQERANLTCTYLDALQDELLKDEIVLSRQALEDAGVGVTNA